jgi:hypothetical protein
MRECGSCGRVTSDDHETICRACGNVTRERIVIKSKRKLLDKKIADLDEQVVDPQA